MHISPDSHSNQDWTTWGKQKWATISQAAETVERRVRIPPLRPHQDPGNNKKHWTNPKGKFSSGLCRGGV